MITCPRELKDGLRKRADSMNISRARIDELAGQPDGYSATLLAEDGAKQMSLASMFAMLQRGLGGALVIVDDPMALARITDSVGSRDKNRLSTSRRSMIKRRRNKVLKDLLKKANAVRNIKVPPEQRSRIARKAIRARWAKARKRKRTMGGSSRRVDVIPCGNQPPGSP